MTSTPPPPEYPPTAPKGRALRRWWWVAALVAVAAVAAIVVAVVVSGNGGDGGYNADRHPSQSSPVEPSPESSTDQLTKSSVDLAWAAFTPEQQSLACSEIARVGDEEAARLMEEGGGVGSGAVIDWDLAVDLIKDKCDAL